MWKNIPNYLTTARVGLIPVFVGCAYLPGRTGLLLSTLFFAVAAITDWADGYIARRHGVQTPFGRFFDPVADKLLVLSALLLLLSQGRAPFVVVLVIMAREITIMALREYISCQGRGVPVSKVGKWKTGLQMAAIIMLLIQDGLLEGISFHLPGTVFLYMATILTLWSGYQYMAGAWSQIRDS